MNFFCKGEFLGERFEGVCVLDGEDEWWKKWGVLGERFWKLRDGWEGDGDDDL